MRSLGWKDVRAIVVLLLASFFFASEDTSVMTDAMFSWGRYLVPLLLFVTAAAYAVERPGRAFLLPFLAANLFLAWLMMGSGHSSSSDAVYILMGAPFWTFFVSWAFFVGAFVGLGVRALGDGVSQGHQAH